MGMTFLCQHGHKHGMAAAEPRVQLYASLAKPLLLLAGSVRSAQVRDEAHEHATHLLRSQQGMVKAPGALPM